MLRDPIVGEIRNANDQKNIRIVNLKKKRRTKSKILDKLLNSIDYDTDFAE